RRKGYHGYVNSSGLRHQRILVPGLAYLLAGGQQDLIDPAYRAVILLWLFLGAYWTSRYAILFGRHPALGLTFLLVPTVIVSLERMTIEIALAALAVAFALEARKEPSWRLYLILVAAVLARETGLLLTGGYLLHLLLRKKLIRAAIFSTSAFPWGVWSYVVRDTSSGFAMRVLQGESSRRKIHGWGFAGIIQRLGKPLRYRLLAGWKLWAVRVADYIGLSGMVTLAVMGVRMAFRRSPGPVELTAALSGIIALCFGNYTYWHHPVHYTRWLAPLLVLVGLTSISKKSWPAGLAILMIDLRIAVEFGPRALQVVESIFS
ncbi:MAG: hypothetical protein GY953_17270, partial [bacterium]|nr:hypothetical protein [bacterium]